jgi:initiation factor 1A
MVKNVSGGNKTKKQKRNFGKYNTVDKLESGQMFAQVVHNNGGSFSVLCSDGITRLGKLSGYMKKGPRITDGSYVVISLRDFESEQKHCDILAYGDPPNDIIELFKIYDPNARKKADVEFVDSDDEFKEFEESQRTMVVLNSNKDNKNDDDFNWDEL